MNDLRDRFLKKEIKKYIEQAQIVMFSLTQYQCAQKYHLNTEREN